MVSAFIFTFVGGAGCKAAISDCVCERGGRKGRDRVGGVRDAIWGDFFAMHLTKLCGMKARTELYRFSLITFKGL